MSDLIEETMVEIKKLQKMAQDKGLPEAKRAEANKLLQEKLRAVFSHADGQRAQLRKAFRRPRRHRVG